MKCLSECFAGPDNKASGRDGEEDTLIDPHPSSVLTFTTTFSQPLVPVLGLQHRVIYT